MTPQRPPATKTLLTPRFLTPQKINPKKTKGGPRGGPPPPPAKKKPRGIFFFFFSGAQRPGFEAMLAEWGRFHNRDHFERKAPHRLCALGPRRSRPTRAYLVTLLLFRSFSVFSCCSGASRPLVSLARSLRTGCLFQLMARDEARALPVSLIKPERVAEALRFDLTKPEHEAAPITLVPLS